jgi:hypothetical protein
MSGHMVLHADQFALIAFRQQILEEGVHIRRGNALWSKRNLRIYRSRIGLCEP